MTSRTPTMEDVAARAGVSRALVSIVFRSAPGASSATRERVLAAARELDYRPDSRASRLGRTRTRALGVVFGVGHPFHGDVIESLYAAADQTGYEIVLSGVSPAGVRSRPPCRRSWRRGARPSCSSAAAFQPGR